MKDDLNKRIDALSETKRKYLQMLMEQKKKKSSSQSENSITRRNDTEVEEIECSSIQKDFWHNWLLSKEEYVNNISGYLCLKGELEEGIVKDAYEDLLDRHEIFRSVFYEMDGHVYARIQQTQECDYECITIPTKTEQEEIVNGIPKTIYDCMVEEARKPFDLEHGPLIRLRLIKSDRNVNWFLIVQHHIISDGASSAIIVKDLLNFVEKRSGFKVNTLPKLEIQYYDYLSYENEKEKEASYEKSKEYWKNALMDCSAIVNLPSDVECESEEPNSGGRLMFHINMEQFDRINKKAIEQKVSLFSYFMTAFKVILYKYTRQEDLTIVIPIQGRNMPQVSDLIGCFINMLPIRTQLSGQKNFEECLQGENKAILGAMDNQKFSFDWVRELTDSREAASAVMNYNIVFSYEGDVLKHIASENFDFEFGELNLGRTKFDLVLELNKVEDGLEGWFEYKAAKYSKKRIERMKDAFLTLLDDSIEHSDEAIHNINTMNQKEERLIRQFSIGEREDWEITTIPNQFSAYAKAHPEDLALIYGEGSLTYSEFESKSNQLANYLVKKGAGSEKVIGIMMDKGPMLFVGIMAILKAGSAYTPIDISYPHDRIDYMLEDSGAILLLTDSLDYEGISEKNFGCNVISVNEVDLSSESEQEPSMTITPDNLAYVLYTSGTTGKPKGVMVEHHGVVNLSQFLKKHYQITASDRVVQFAHIVFDASVWEMAMSFMIGAPLCLVSNEVILNVGEFVEMIKKFKVTIGCFPPQYYRQIMQEDINLRIIYTAGSAADLKIAETASEKSLYVNAYGPTENTVCGSVWDYNKDELSSLSVPIGKPLSNVETFIVNDHTLCGINMIGELCLSGAQVARGYRNREELTEKTFTDNLFGDGKLYHTGDYARWNEDGNIDFIGRIDNQVKIRGYRIEIGEVENSLLAIPAIRDATVVVYDDASGEKALSAYMILEEDISVMKIKEILSENLPYYMIPLSYYTVDEFPVNTSGKINIVKLKEIGVRLETESAYVAPTNENEKILEEIWREILGLSCVGIDDDFFQIGGDSILVMQVISKAAARGLKIELKSFYNGKTIRNIAADMEQLALSQAAKVNATTYPLTPIQNWFFRHNFVNENHWNFSILLESEQKIEEENLNKALNCLIESHDILRCSFQDKEDGTKVTEILPFTYESRVKTFVVNEEEDLEEKFQEIQSSLSLKEGILIKAGLFKNTYSQEDRILLTAHHLVVDSISLQQLSQELFNIYEQILQGKEEATVFEQSSYMDYAGRYNEYLQEDTQMYERQQWREQIQTGVIPCKKDFDTSNNTESTARKLSVSLNKEETESLLKEVSKEYKVTTQELLIAAIVDTISKWSNESGVILLESHGRDLDMDEYDLSGSIGWFTTLYPYYFPKIETTSSDELLKTVKNGLFQAKEKRFTWLPEMLLNKDAGWPEIVFNYLGQIDALSNSGEIKIITDYDLHTRDTRNERVALIEINCFITEDELKIELVYGESIFKEQTMKELINTFKKKVLELSEYCINSTEEGITVSDFGNADLDEDELEFLLSKF